MAQQVYTSDRQDPFRRKAVAIMRVVLGLAGAMAIAALVLEYGGFRNLPDWLNRDNLHLVQSCVLGIFVLNRLLRLALARRRWQFLRENWADFALLVVAAGAFAAAPRLHTAVLPAASIYIIITQVYLLASLASHAVGVNLTFAGSGVPPSVLLAGSFVALILVGSGLLMLPAARPAGTNLYYEDALFTATSAVCVTGLIVKDTGRDFTPFGQAVILAMIQFGGLGIMMFGTMMAVLVGKGLTLRSSSAMGEMLSGASGVGEIARTLKFVLLSTLGLEAIGAALLYPMFADGAAGDMTRLQAGWHSVFHSVSSFCNAGFSLLTGNLMEGVGRIGSPVRDRWQTLGVFAPLIVLGGLGFPVLQNVAAWSRDRVKLALGRLRRGRRSAPAARPRLSLHAKIVLSASLLLVVFGALGLLAVEPMAGGDSRVIGRHPVGGRVTGGDWGRMSPPRRVREALFQSVSARTAGFNTIDMAELSDAGKLWMCGLMVVGGSPASTAGGMKTVTFVLLLLAVYSVLRRREEVEVFRRSIASNLMRRVTTVAVLYMALVGATTLALSLCMRGDEPFLDLLFEACSACGTVGLSTGVTGHLNLSGKLVIVVAMFVGRVGPLTLLWALTSSIRRIAYSYPQEDVVIG